MRDLTRGRSQVEVVGETVGQIIDALDVAYPGIRTRLMQGGRIDRAISVVVDGKVARLGLPHPVGEQSEVHFLPAVAGGTPRPLEAQQR